MARCHPGPSILRHTYMQKIESKVVQAILQQADKVKIGGTEYTVQQPTLATLAMLSELVASLPDYKMEESVLSNVIACARESVHTVSRIAALLILGAARIKERRVVEERHGETRPRWSWRKLRHVYTTRTEERNVLEYDRVARDIEDTLTPEELNAIITKRLCDMQVGDFFAITASLKGQNMLAATRGAEETASGE